MMQQVQRVYTSDNVTRIIKKSCPSNKLTVCMGQRDFIDCYTHIEVIDGVINLEMERLRNSDVIMLCVSAIFRYGRDDAEAMGMDFRKELYKHTHQVYPEVRKKPPILSPFQQKLVDKMGANCTFPFTIELPKNTPASVSLQVEPGEPGKPCGVDYELKCYVSDDLNKDKNPKDMVSMVIRKLTFAPPTSVAIPAGETVKEFKGNGGKVRLELALNREVYYHGDTVEVHVTINNNSDKTIRRIKLQIIQEANITIHNKTNYKRQVAELESEDGFPIHGGTLGFCRTYRIIPTLNRSRDKVGLALDGKLKYEDTGLASSTIVHDSRDRENMGIIVTYLVKAKLIFGIGTSDVSLEVPFVLSHPSKYKKADQKPVLASRDDPNEAFDRSEFEF